MDIVDFHFAVSRVRQQRIHNSLRIVCVKKTVEKFADKVEDDQQENLSKTFRQPKYVNPQLVLKEFT